MSCRQKEQSEDSEYMRNMPELLIIETRHDQKKWRVREEKYGCRTETAKKPDNSEPNQKTVWQV
jgi:hypothetical protein